VVPTIGSRAGEDDGGAAFDGVSGRVAGLFASTPIIIRVPSRRTGGGAELGNCIFNSTQVGKEYGGKGSRFSGNLIGS
jgi:hypothetical protein